MRGRGDDLIPQVGIPAANQARVLAAFKKRFQRPVQNWPNQKSEQRCWGVEPLPGPYGGRPCLFGTIISQNLDRLKRT